MFEHIWNGKTLGWMLAPPGRVPEPGDLEKADLCFVWGFLMDPRFVQGITGRPIPLAPAVIRGYRRETVVTDGGRAFRLVPEQNGMVLGVVLVGPSREEVEALDRFEQVPQVMVRKRIDVLVGDQVREASIYLAA